jgi:hypothetical protein
MSINEIFSVFELDPVLLTPARRYKLDCTLRAWRPSEERLAMDSDLTRRIELNRGAEMERILTNNFSSRKSLAAKLSA